MKKKNKKLERLSYILLAVVIAILGYVIIVADAFDIRFLLRKKTDVEQENLGCAFGISNRSNSVQNHFRISNIFYLFEDEFPKQILGKNNPDSIYVITWEPFSKENKNRNMLFEIQNGSFDDHIMRFALAAKEFGGNIILRFAHEMNGNWYPWSGYNSNRESRPYIEAIKRIKTIFVSSNANNVLFAFGINNQDIPSSDWNRFENYYPGDEVIDLIMIDAYNWSKYRRSPTRLLRDSYERSIKAFPSKPIIIGEIATTSNGVDKAGWIDNLFDRIQFRFTAIKGIIWFDINKEEDWSFSEDLGLRKLVYSKLEMEYFKKENQNLKWMFKNEKR